MRAHSFCLVGREKADLELPKKLSYFRKEIAVTQNELVRLESLLNQGHKDAFQPRLEATVGAAQPMLASGGRVDL